MALLCHLLGVVGFFGPLVIWLVERDKHRYVDEQGREAMNYQISLMIYLAALGITAAATTTRVNHLLSAGAGRRYWSLSDRFRRC